MNRGELLYIANFGAATIDKMSLSDLLDSQLLQRRFRIPERWLISQDSQYLLVAHYANGATVRRRRQSHHSHSSVAMGRA